MTRKVKAILLIMFLLVGFVTRSQVDDTRANTPVPFTLADRDRILRTENKLEMLNERIDSFEKRVDERFAAQDKRLDDLYTLMILLLGSMFALFGFILWDRKSTVRPV